MHTTNASQQLYRSEGWDKRNCYGHKCCVRQEKAERRCDMREGTL